LVQIDDIADPTKTIADMQAMDRDIKQQKKVPKIPKGVFEMRPFEDNEEKQLEALDEMMNPSKQGLPPLPDRKKESLAEQKSETARARKAALERPPDEDDVTQAMDGSEDSMERLARALHKQTSLNPMIQEAKQKQLANADESLQEQIDWSKEREKDKKRQWPPAPNDMDQGNDNLFKNLSDESATSGDKVDLGPLSEDSQPSAHGQLKALGQDNLDKLLAK